MAEPACGVLARLDQGGADAAPLEPLEDLEMVEQGHAWEVVADLGRVGRAAVQEYVADRPAVEPGDQQHPASVLLPASRSVKKCRCPRTATSAARSAGAARRTSTVPRGPLSSDTSKLRRIRPR